MVEFPRYESYKDSGVEWLGKIPSHWNIVRLGYLSEVIDPQPDHRAPPIARENGFPYIGIRDVNKDGSLCFETARLVVEKAVIKQEKSFSISQKDILFGKVGTLGQPKHIKPHGRFALSATLVLIKGKDNINRTFLKYALDSDSIYRQIEDFSYGATRPALGIQQIRKFQILQPPLEEQQKIADFLERKTTEIDEAIAKKQKLIELLQEQKAILINRSVTKGLNPNVKMRDRDIDWIGEIPEYWEVKKIKFATTIFRGKFTHRPRNDPKLYDGKYPFIQTGDIAKSGKFITEYRQTLNDKGLKVSTLIPKGTVVITIAANIGDISILGFDACFPDSVVGFYPKEELKRDFLYYVLVAMKQQFINSSTKNTQMNLNIERIGSNFIAIPSLEEQVKIVLTIESIIVRIHSLEISLSKNIQSLQEYKQILISNAVTGKIKI